MTRYKTAPISRSDLQGVVLVVLGDRMQLLICPLLYIPCQIDPKVIRWFRDLKHEARLSIVRVLVGGVPFDFTAAHQLACRDLNAMGSKHGSIALLETTEAETSIAVEFAVGCTMAFGHEPYVSMREWLAIDRDSTRN